VARKILVTGGTGTLGRVLVDRLLHGPTAETGDEVVVASRRPRPLRPTPYTWMTVDYATGEGLDAAVDGSSAIIHCASDFRNVDLDRAVIDAARRAGGVHLVYISIVGIDRVRLGYYQVKLAAERLIEGSDVPWTILRTTQFHDLAAKLCQSLARLPVAFAPTFSIQPVDVRDVSDRLAGLAAATPAGRVSDLGGPLVLPFGDLVRAYLRANRRQRPVLPLWLPGRVFHDYQRGYHLTPDHADGKITFDQYIAEQEHRTPPR
jgi:uncharacterized protein YbjT (DUF2867 family)